MNLLLDTHALLWWLAGDDRLPRESIEAIADRRNRVAVSAASAWELAIKQAIGKVRAPEDLEGEIDRQGFEKLPIDFASAQLAGQLPPHHRDPFDRMLIAQAQLGGLTILTHDQRFARYAVPIMPI